MNATVLDVFPHDTIVAFICVLLRQRHNSHCCVHSDLGGSASGFGSVMEDFEGVRRCLGVLDDDHALDVHAQLESSVSVGGGIDADAVMRSRRAAHERKLAQRGSIGFPALQAAAARFQSEMLYGAAGSAVPG